HLPCDPGHLRVRPGRRPRPLHRLRGPRGHVDNVAEKPERRCSSQPFADGPAPGVAARATPTALAFASLVRRTEPVPLLDKSGTTPVIDEPRGDDPQLSGVLASLEPVRRAT